MLGYNFLRFCTFIGIFVSAKAYIITEQINLDDTDVRTDLLTVSERHALRTYINCYTFIVFQVAISKSIFLLRAGIFIVSVAVLIYLEIAFGILNVLGESKTSGANDSDDKDQANKENKSRRKRKSKHSEQNNARPNGETENQNSGCSNEPPLKRSNKDNIEG